MGLEIDPKGGGCWPTPLQQSLIEAALNRRPVVETWIDYIGAKNPADANAGEARLFPLLAAHLPRAERAMPLFSPLIKAQIRAGARDVRNCRELAPLLTELRKNGIDAVLTKGFALMASVYRDGGLRPTADVDIVIPLEQVTSFFGLAEKNGWKQKYVHSGFTAKMLRYRSTGINFKLSQHLDIDIHLNLRTELLFEQDVLPWFWKNTRSVEWAGQIWKIPSPTWLLIETILHGTIWNNVHSMRWIIDAHYLLTQEQDIDWRLILDLSKRAHLTLIFRTALEYLVQLGAAVPKEVLAQLAGRKPSLLERVDYNLRLKPEGFFARYFPREPVNYWLRASGGSVEKLRGFPSYFFVSQLGIARARDMPSVVIEKFFSRLTSLRHARAPNSGIRRRAP